MSASQARASESDDGELDPLVNASSGYYETVFQFIRARVGTRELALDLTQDVFVELIIAWPRLDHDRSILPWLLVVARRRVVDELRRQRYRTRLLEEMRPFVTTTSTNSLTQSELLRGLEPAARRVIYSRVFAEETFAKIAEETGISCGACRMRYLRAIKELRALFGAILVLCGT